MDPRVVVVGLGPGSVDLLTREAWDVLNAAPVLYLRTTHHPVVASLSGRVPLHSLDQAGGPEAIVEQLLAAPAPAVYAVPGHPMVGEATTRLLRRRLGPDELRIVAGLSFVEPVCTLLGVDPLESGLALYDAFDLAGPPSPFAPTFPLDPTQPLLVAHVCGQVTGLQRALLGHYPAGHPTVLVCAASISGQERVVEGRLDRLEQAGALEELCTLYLPPLPRPQARREPATLEWIMARLRGPGGCPWDQEQTHASLRNNLLEECYEVLDALDRGDLGSLREELGDLLMQVYLHAQLAREEGAFDLADVVEGIVAKLIRRHPHVFGEVEVADSSEVLRNWEAIKAAERAKKGKESASLLDGIPPTLPALAYAQALVERAARVRFDWERLEEVWAKVEEELAELRQAGSAEEQAEEMGDLLFALVNLARWLSVEAEDALRATNGKFRRRFAHLEETARRRGIPVEKMSVAEMDALWKEAKDDGL